MLAPSDHGKWYRMWATGATTGAMQPESLGEHSCSGQHTAARCNTPKKTTPPPDSCCEKLVGSGERRAGGGSGMESPSLPAVAAYLRGVPDTCLHGGLDAEHGRSDSHTSALQPVAAVLTAYRNHLHAACPHVALRTPLQRACSHTYNH